MKEKEKNKLKNRSQKGRLHGKVKTRRLLEELDEDDPVLSLYKK
jgi:hypothetical protein